MYKKTIKILMLILSLFIFVGCDSFTQEKDHTGEKFKISYICNNELIDIENNEYTCGETFVLPTLNINGFVGWYNNKNLNGEDIKVIEKEEYGNKIFYAKIDESRIKYNIEYYDGDKLLNLTPDSYQKGSSFSLPNPGIKEGYEFIGWFSDNLFTNQVSDIKTTDSSDKVFYAKYEQVIFSIKYYDGETELKLTPSNYRIGSTVNLPILEDKNDLEFLGWYKEKEFIHKIETINETDKEDFILYAKYAVNIKYVVNADIFSDAIKLVNRGKGLPIAMPSTGNVKALIVPVDFSDYPANSNLNEKINTAFFGSSEETGWESLATYYEKSSYGKLHISGVISDVYHTNKSSSYYSRKDEVEAADEIIEGALNTIDSKIDFSEFDINNDGYVDAIYFIYTAPVDFDGYVSDLWWAYCDQYGNSNDVYDGKSINYYMFAGTDFFDETPASGKKVKVNAETFIHETGHLLGLDDYYDYDTSDRYNKGGIGGGDMMDYNVGDHNPYSKSILGWITPQLINVNDNVSEYNISLSSFALTGEALIIAKRDITSFYDEYYIIDYYKPEGLNEFAAGVNGLFSKSGIRVYHISATLTSETIDCMWDMTKFNNADSRYKLIKLIEADGGNDIDREKESTNSDLFSMGATITNLKWNDGTSLNISIKVVNINDNSAQLQIRK